MAITVDVADDGSVQVRTADIGAFVQHFGPRLSGKGLLLETQESLPRGRELELRMGLDEGLDLVEAVAMVAWKRRQAGDQPAAVGLHLLAVTSGAEFIQRLVDERTQGGRPVFDLDLASPVSEDGSPIEADQIDRMIARRGERSVAADLEVEGAGADPAPADATEEAPDFAPGFGKSETWNQQLQAGMPRSVSSWLGGEQSAGPAAQAAGTEKPREAAPSDSADSDTAASDTAGGNGGDAESDRVEAPKPAAGGGTAQESKPAEAGRESWRSSDPEVKPPAGSPTEETTDRPTPAASGSPSPPAKRSGPIKMKLAADRQPSGGSASESLSGALESSFVEASRRAENLLRDDPPKVAEAAPPTPAEALSTVVLKPDEMKRMVDRVRGRAEQEAGAGPAGAEARPPVAEGTSDGSAASAGHSSPGASDESPAAAETPPEPEPSLLDMDRAVLQAAAEESFGYPQEDRTPMIIVGGIVFLIVVGLVLWLILT